MSAKQPSPAPANDGPKATAPPQTAAFVLPPNPRRPGAAKRRAMLLSALIIIGLPTTATTVYYTFFATDQFASGGHFVVRHSNQESTANMGGALSSLGLGAAAAGTSVPDVMIVNEYMVSLQIIKDLEPLINLRAIYDASSIDPLARLRTPHHHGKVSDEELRNYWQSMVDVRFDHTTGLSRLEVRAFSAEDAKQIADQVFLLGEALVNRLSDRAQQDALALARQEVETYRAQAIAALDALLLFQENAKQVDPVAFAEARMQIQAGVEHELTQLQAQLAILRKSLPDDAPGVAQMRGRLEVLQGQLVNERVKSTTSDSGESAAQLLNNFAKLRLESEFATKAYMSSLASLESARQEAIKQTLYLETFVRPQLPQIPEYPKATRNVILVLVISFLFWAIGGLMISVAREHL